MKKLELKIPPPVVALIAGILMFVVSIKTTNHLLPFSFNNQAAVFFVLLGTLLDISALWYFKRAQTTINPVNPKKTTKLVTTGVYKLTRNPMYLGMTFILFGWACYLGSALGLLVLPLFILYIHRFQIKPEESVLLSLFGDEFTQYKHRVGRWL